MQNRRVLEALAQQGDVHELPRKVDHWLHFARRATRAACRETLTAIEFAVEDESMSEEEGDDLRYPAGGVADVDSVDSHTINGITIELARLAREHDGALRRLGLCGHARRGRAVVGDASMSGRMFAIADPRAVLR